jgi:hypothetical protein
MGHEVAVKDNTIDTDIKLTLNTGTGYYLVKVITPSGLISKKVFIK